MRILVVEDNRRLNYSLKMSLLDDSYAVDVAFDGQEGQDFAELTPYDAIILDVMLPLKDGLEVCRELRRQRINTPIIMLTARDTVEDRIQGLDSGADDYLVKPFSLAAAVGSRHDSNFTHLIATHTKLFAGAYK